jgi:hypothetical protein
MAWTYTPDTGTTGSGGAPWTTGYSVALSDFVAAENDIHTWGGDVNAGTHKLTNCTGISCASGANLNLGAGLQVQSTTADSQMYVSDTAPRIALGNNATYGSRTQATRWVMATAGGNFGLPNAGDAWLFTEALGAGVAGDLYLGANSSIGQVVLKKNGNIFLLAPTYASDAAAGTGGLTAGMIWKDSSGNLHSKL